jgi:hypothetical protein
MVSRAGLGGGSHVSHVEGATFTVGPQSVGQHLTRDALCFGGHTCTATDVATALGRMSIQGSHAPPQGVHRQCVQALLQAAFTIEHPLQTGPELLPCIACSQKQACSYLYSADIPPAQCTYLRKVPGVWLCRPFTRQRPSGMECHAAAAGALSGPYESHKRCCPNCSCINIALG